MFRAESWANAFDGALGENAEAGLRCLEALIPPLRALPRGLSGHGAARRLEGILRESIRAANLGAAEAGAAAAAESAARFVVLLVERGRFKHVNDIMEKIEERIDARNGALAAVLETAEPIDGASADEFAWRIAERTGAASVRLKTRLSPELLGGYRLQIRGLRIDASLKAQLEKMKAAMEAAALACGSPAAAAEGARDE